MFYSGEYYSEYVLASYSLVFHVIRICGMDPFPEGRCLEMVNTGGWVGYVGFLDIIYPYRVYLCPGVSFTGIRFIVHVSVIVFTGTVMP